MQLLFFFLFFCTFGQIAYATSQLESLFPVKTLEKRSHILIAHEELTSDKIRMNKVGVLTLITIAYVDSLNKKIVATKKNIDGRFLLVKKLHAKL